MIRSFENRDWAATWRIIEPVFRVGESYPFSPDITEEDAYNVWIEIPSATYVAVDKGNDVAVGNASGVDASGVASGVCLCLWGRTEIICLEYT